MNTSASTGRKSSKLSQHATISFRIYVPDKNANHSISTPPASSGYHILRPSADPPRLTMKLVLPLPGFPETKMNRPWPRSASSTARASRAFLPTSWRETADSCWRVYSSVTRSQSVSPPCHGEIQRGVSQESLLEGVLLIYQVTVRVTALRNRGRREL